jgi:hypothetical protein
VGDRARVDAQLQVGDASQTVEVLAPSPLLQSETSTVSSSITEHAAQDIPLPTRNLTTLVTYTAGANEGASVDSLSSGQRPDDRRQTSAFSMNGQDVELNNEQIDGTDNNGRIIGTIDNATMNQVPTTDQIAAGTVSPAFGQVVVTTSYLINTFNRLIS